LSRTSLATGQTWGGKNAQVFEEQANRHRQTRAPLARRKGKVWRYFSRIFCGVSLSGSFVPVVSEELPFFVFFAKKKEQKGVAKKEKKTDVGHGPKLRQSPPPREEKKEKASQGSKAEHQGLARICVL
jgi:hypothetical protein